MKKKKQNIPKLTGKNKSSAKRVYNFKQINKQYINNLNLPNKELEKE